MATATVFSTAMALLTGNAGGNVQNLPAVNVAGARQRIFVGNIALAAQASGTVIAVARVPVGSVITGITLLTDTSLSTAQIALGDANSGAIYAAAQTLTSTNTPTRVGKQATQSAPIATGYDCQTGAANYAYEDILLTTSVASLPGSGNLTIIVEYALD